MSEISETEIKSMTKEQNYMRGYKDGKSDVLDKIRTEIISRPYEGFEIGSFKDGYIAAVIRDLDIINKYKTESEVEK